MALYESHFSVQSSQIQNNFFVNKQPGGGGFGPAPPRTRIIPRKFWGACPRPRKLHFRNFLKNRPKYTEPFSIPGARTPEKKFQFRTLGRTPRSQTRVSSNTDTPGGCGLAYTSTKKKKLSLAVTLRVRGVQAGRWQADWACQPVGAPLRAGPFAAWAAWDPGRAVQPCPTQKMHRWWMATGKTDGSEEKPAEVTVPILFLIPQSSVFSYLPLLADFH